MLGCTILVMTSHRQTRRQIAGALGAGGIQAHFAEEPAAFRSVHEEVHPDLLILDCDSSAPPGVVATIDWICQNPKHAPVVLLSVGADKAALLDLVQSHDVANLVAKHGAIRASFPVLDERELLVTVEKVMRRNIFGLDKYVASWGVVLHRDLITSTNDKFPFLQKFEKYITDLDAPQSVIPQIVTVAEELILNAVVHAPVKPDGTPKYEELGPQANLFLEPNEFVEVVYGCDGQRLMFSVSDNFGKLAKKTLYNYLSRGFDAPRIEAESKPGGAGLGLSLSFRSIHQLVFNIQDQVRTEVIAGWYLRVSTASEFRQVGKSLNLFWLPKDSQPVAEEVPFERAEQTHPGAKPPTSFLRGRIDETTDFEEARRAAVLDLREVVAVSSRGLLLWLRFVRSMAEHKLELIGCPDALVRLAGEVAGVLEGVVVKTLLVPFECRSCANETAVEMPTEAALNPPTEKCSACGGPLTFTGDREQYRSIFKLAS